MFLAPTSNSHQLTNTWWILDVLFRVLNRFPSPLINVSHKFILWYKWVPFIILWWPCELLFYRINLFKSYGQIVSVEETIATAWSKLVSSFNVEYDGTPIHIVSRILSITNSYLKTLEFDFNFCDDPIVLSTLLVVFLLYIDNLLSSLKGRIYVWSLTCTLWFWKSSGFLSM